ncbi:MAG: tetratricopeptide repeat protein, partial [Bacteroidota bacterium]
QSGMLLCPDSNYGQIIIINNTSEAAYEDWASLYNKMETDLIMYPKINLMRLVKPDLVNNPKEGIARFKNLSKSKKQYFNTDLNYALNYLSYELAQENNDTKKAIELLRFALEEFPKDANLYDSLGEMYFLNKDYDSALENYRKSLELNPDNENAEEYIAQIERLLKEG